MQTSFSMHIVNSAHIPDGTLNVDETVQLAEQAASLLSLTDLAKMRNRCRDVTISQQVRFRLRRSPLSPITRQFPTLLKIYFGCFYKNRRCKIHESPRLDISIDPFIYVKFQIGS
jgi:hypothetical protein